MNKYLSHLRSKDVLSEHDPRRVSIRLYLAKLEIDDMWDLIKCTDDILKFNRLLNQLQNVENEVEVLKVKFSELVKIGKITEELECRWLLPYKRE